MRGSVLGCTNRKCLCQKYETIRAVMVGATRGRIPALDRKKSWDIDVEEQQIIIKYFLNEFFTPKIQENLFEETYEKDIFIIHNCVS